MLFAPVLRIIPTAVLVLGVASLQAAVQVDEAIKPYELTQGVTGNLNSIGSDTLNNLMTYWAEGFKKKYPNVKIQIEGKGSSTAPPALIAGTAQLGPMSRPMSSKEIDDFEKKFGYKPTPVKVAIDALAVIVHKDNSLKGMTLDQIDSVFSSTFKRGGKNIGTWGLLGVTEMADSPISLFGRNSASGTYGYFKEHALKKGDYKPTVAEQPGSSAVVQSVATDKEAIGYTGIGYVTSGVRALWLGEKADALIEPTYDNCLNGSYPLARFLYVNINKAPGKPVDTLTAEFLKFVLSKDGQEIVVKDGYFPLTAAMTTESVDGMMK